MGAQQQPGTARYDPRDVAGVLGLVGLVLVGVISWFVVHDPRPQAPASGAWAGLGQPQLGRRDRPEPRAEERPQRRHVPRRHQRQYRLTGRHEPARRPAQAHLPHPAQ